MQQLITVWQALDTRRRLIVAGATAAVFAAILMLSSMASNPTLSLLYAQLDGTQAADVITALEQRGVKYEVRGDAIYVEAAKRDELRMSLAGEGLPQTGGAGYELLDSLSGFGTTSQMFDAAYWRAKEGELARTIVSSPSIRSARVHIANPSGQPFRRDLRATASVTVASTGNGITPAQAKALQFMVSSAVAGLSPEDVSIIDTQVGLVATGEDQPGIAARGDMAAELKHNVERLLEARVGYGKAVVEVSVDTVTEREAITEHRFDPETRVAISTDTEERTNSANNVNPGAVTVASNLPSGNAQNGGESKSSGTETRERINYEVSETRREIVRAPGSVKRLTVAVLIDGAQTTNEAGETVWAPRPDDELSALRDLVASAVGFDETRGDVITIKSMPFEPLTDAGTLAQSGFLANIALDTMSLIQLGVLSLVALILGIFVLRPILMRPAPVVSAGELPAPVSATNPDALNGEIQEGDFSGDLPMLDMGGMNMPMAMGDFGEGGGDDSDPVARLKRLIAERQTESVEILRNWMEEREEKA
ncbi:flagellar basal-body MS-ring/collar protein FliF [Phaeovulum vinaykumarii]|uniref:Flagellar M-ring protein n=1 Tax=Phaeovulum vinaykumarii TaxID=407234 RepID=A0A1N7KAX5_9RHOB|nr:flagellar basal-body MS-ring/collar protein FliF [Phaeovulum vinaykumarii]SIS58756.1 flagellar M-ring protein FliF [Phaeovulum vinaykumarii]SOB93908.1 flagellar M-ring protein FliF [Phaeovulum vinaykumarii]